MGIKLHPRCALPTLAYLGAIHWLTLICDLRVGGTDPCSNSPQISSTFLSLLA